MTLSNAGSLTEQELEEQIELSACPNLSNIRGCSADVTDVTVQNGRRRKLSRQLQSSDVLIEFTLWILNVCGTTDCSDAQAVSDALYSQATADLRNAIENGSLLSTLSSDPSVTANIDFCPVIIPVLAQLADHNTWYPDWREQSQTCKNDGEYP